MNDRWNKDRVHNGAGAIRAPGKNSCPDKTKTDKCEDHPTDRAGVASCDEAAHLLSAWQKGDREALDQLMPIVHRELWNIARGCLKNGRIDFSMISPTSLVNEAYLKLVKHKAKKDRPWNHIAEFYGLVTTVMLHILADHARKKRAKRHGGGLAKITLEEESTYREREVDPLELKEILDRLETLDLRLSHIWKCRYIGGLSIGEIAAVFDLSHATIHKELKAANGWIRRFLQEKEEGL